MNNNSYRYLSDLDLSTFNRRNTRHNIKEGIITLAIREISPCSFVAGASFCSPRDVRENKWRKEVGRGLAIIKQAIAVPFEMPEKFTRLDLTTSACKAVLAETWCSSVPWAQRQLLLRTYSKE